MKLTPTSPPRRRPPAKVAVAATIAGLVAGLAWTAAGSGPASAAASPVCGGRSTKSIGGKPVTAQYCGVWLPSGGVPVFRTPSDHRVIGYLYEGGRANWFDCELDSPELPATSAGGHSSRWYARTLADNNVEGWVSGVYYAGSEPYFKGLDYCAP